MKEIFAFYAIPWLIIFLFQGTCNFKNPDKPIVSTVWVISSKVVSILFAGGWVIVSLYAQEIRDEYEYWFALLVGATGYYCSSFILLRMGRDFKNKKVVTIKNDDNNHSS